MAQQHLVHGTTHSETHDHPFWWPYTTNHSLWQQSQQRTTVENIDLIPGVGSFSRRMWGWSRLRTCQTVPLNTLVDWNMLKTTNELARIRYQEEVQNTPNVHKYHLQNR